MAASLSTEFKEVVGEVRKWCKPSGGKSIAQVRGNGYLLTTNFHVHCHRTPCSLLAIAVS